MIPVNIVANYYQDAGHGWIEVSRNMLHGLGIADKITNYSYIKGNAVYLEEDCDASTLIRAIEAKGNKLVTFAIDHGDNSPIRNYDRYEVSK